MNMGQVFYKVHFKSNSTGDIVYSNSQQQQLTREGCPRGVMVKALDYGVNEFELQSRYYVHFWTNTLGKGMNPLILRAMG